MWSFTCLPTLTQIREVSVSNFEVYLYINIYCEYKLDLLYSYTSH